jgi:pimeloyl-ACP methyl ester carboxylesterase
MRWLTLRRAIFVLVGVCVLSYLGAILYLVTQETRLVFQAGRPLAESRPSFPYEQIDLPRPDRARQFAWVMKQSDPDSSPWLLFLHGNASTIASRMNILHYTELRAFGLNVIAPEYRGYAGTRWRSQRIEPDR